MQTSYRPLSYFSERIPGSKGAECVSPSTMTRWVMRGVKGATGHTVRLRAARVGGRWLTTDEWFDDFVTALSASPEGEDAVRTPSEIRRAADEAGRELEAAGA